MVDVAKHEAVLGTMDNDPNVAANPKGPEVGVSCPVDLVELKARA